MDPADPNGTLLNNTWLTSANGMAFTSSVHAVATPRSSYILPVLVSAGPNLKVGLNPDMSIAAPAGDSDDNIYSFMLR